MLDAKRSARVLKRGLTLCGREVTASQTRYRTLFSFIEIGSREGQTPF